MPTVPPSLVKYETPILLGDGKAAKKPRRAGGGGGAATSAAATTTAAAGGAASGSHDVEDVLSSIVAPHVFEDGGQRWIQYPSSTPATRLDVINLQEQLDLQLEQRRARETGICPIREELYGQAFDELIRQVTVGCAERGLLLLRVRDEMRMTLAAYRSLYESSVAFGMRRALLAEQERNEAQQSVMRLRREKEELERQLADLVEQCEVVERREAERRADEDRRHEEELAYFRKTHQTLTMNLQALVNPTTR